MIKILLKIRFLYYWYIFPWIKLLREDRNELKVPFIKRMKIFIKGFKSEKYYEYELNIKDIKQFVSDYHRNRLHFLNKKYSLLFNDKIIFSRFISSYARTPIIYAQLMGSKIYPLTSEPHIKNHDEVIDLIKKKIIIVKPIAGSGGEGIFKIEYTDNIFILNEKRITEEELRKLLSKLYRFLVSEFIIQGDYISEVFPRSANTVRIITYINPKTEKAQTLFTAQRIGFNKSVPVDNVTRGGMFVHINPSTGIMEEAIVLNENNKIVRYSKHPETGVTFTSRKIPNWEEHISKILIMQELLSPFFKLIGWDILFTNEEFFVIECNPVPDFGFQEILPLKTDQNFMEFLKFHKIIK